MPQKLHYSSLKKSYIEKLNELINITSSNLNMGQESAINLLKNSLNIKNKNYNIFLSGEEGIGKTFFAKKYAEDLAKKEGKPFDYLYVYNFKNPNRPSLLTFLAGEGKIFKNEIKNLIHYISIEVSIKFNSHKYINEKEEIVNKYQKLQDKHLNNIDKIAKENGFQLRSGKTSFYFIPIDSEEISSEEDFLNLSYEKKEKYNLVIKEIQDLTLKDAKEIQELENELKNKLDSLEYNTFLFILGKNINFLQEKYINKPFVLEYINDLKEDILLNRNAFFEQLTEEDELLPILPFGSAEPKENIFDKYTVNLFLDNSETNGAPVILDYKPNYSNLNGYIEFEGDGKNRFTEHMKIKPGLLHKANGGYLILRAKDLLTYPYSFEILISSLETGKIEVEYFKEQTNTSHNLTHIKADYIPLNLKVILVGDEGDYEFLAQVNPSFIKLFKSHILFDYEMDNSDENILSIINFINYICQEEKLFKPEVKGVNLILQYLNRVSETQNKFSTNIEVLKEILIEANYFAISSEKTSITEEDVYSAIYNKNYSNNIYEKKFNNMILENDILIETKGKAIGQINGLVVLDYGEYYFGKPSKVTATTYMGEEGVINIEKESNISGNIHNKGVQILSGYLGQKYAQKFPLSLTCNICLEQNYSGVDGDSCTSTELYAILSSLAEVPINQGIAVTGSMNQKGEIQPVGGITQKIEGFFDVCKFRGLTGNQGVIIPYQNTKDLCLKDEVVSAVKEDKFFIYPIKNVDEGIEALTGTCAGILDENGKYTEGSIHFKVLDKLKSFYESSND